MQQSIFVDNFVEYVKFVHIQKFHNMKKNDIIIKKNSVLNVVGTIFLFLHSNKLSSFSKILYSRMFFFCNGKRGPDALRYPHSEWLHVFCSVVCFLFKFFFLDFEAMCRIFSTIGKCCFFSPTGTIPYLIKMLNSN